MQIARNIRDAFDSILFWILSYYSIRLFLFKWYIQVIVCSYSLYTIFMETKYAILAKISTLKTILKISSIIPHAIKLFKVAMTCTSPLGLLTVEIPKLLYNHFKDWIKQREIGKIREFALPFIQEQVINYIKNKSKELVINKIKDKKKTLLFSLIGISLFIISYILTCIYWPLRLIANLIITILLSYYIFTNHNKISIYLEKYLLILHKFIVITEFFLLSKINSKFLSFYLYCFNFVKGTFKVTSDSYHENQEIFTGKSIVSQMNLLVISISPLFIFIRYATSNIFWLCGIATFGIVLYILFNIYDLIEVFQNILKWIMDQIVDFLMFLSDVQDISEEILDKLRGYIDKSLHWLISLGYDLKVLKIEHEIRMKFEELLKKEAKERETNYDNPQVEDTQKEEKAKDKETQKEDKEKDQETKDEKVRIDVENRNNDNDVKLDKDEDKDSLIFDQFISFVQQYKIQICITIVVYTFYQNLFYAYLRAFIYSTLLFAIYSLYQYTLEQLSNKKLNYYSIMWMFFFLNRQIIVLKIWIRFFSYQSFMTNKHYSFRGLTVLQIIYIIMQSIRILINVIEICFYIYKGKSKRIRSEDIISTMIFPF